MVGADAGRKEWKMVDDVPMRAQEAPRSRQVALMVETSVVYSRQILRGIARYLRGFTAWDGNGTVQAGVLHAP